MSKVNKPDVLYYENFNLQDIVTPVDVDAYEALLIEANYDANETKFLCDGFSMALTWDMRD